MRPFASAACAFIAILMILPCGPARAGEPPAPTPTVVPLGPHDGVVTKMKAHAFETVLSPDGVSVYLYDPEMAPMMMQRVKAVASVIIKGAPPTEIPLALDFPKDGERILYFCPMHPAVAQMKPGKCEACGGMELIPQDRIRGALDLSRAAGAVTAAVTIHGLKGSESDVAFTIVWPVPAKK